MGSDRLPLAQLSGRKLSVSLCQLSPLVRILPDQRYWPE